MKVKSLSRAPLLVTPWIAAYQAPPSMGFSRQEYWSGLPLLSPVNMLEGHKIIYNRVINLFYIRQIQLYAILVSELHFSNFKVGLALIYL